MEGKALLFKNFAGVDAFPVCIDVHSADEIVETVERIAPTFGGINLEDIAAPVCFEVEERLKASLDIPVFHDDQHGTAVVVLAALQNALKLTDKKMSDLRVVIAGVGAAGVACGKILLEAGVAEIVGADRKGAIWEGRDDLNPAKQWFAEHTNPDRRKGAVGELLAGADVFIGVSGPGIIEATDLDRMNTDPFVFALANPDPEIRPEEAKGRAAIIATGRSDFPNQINNVLAFPGIFRGALDVHATADHRGHEAGGGRGHRRVDPHGRARARLHHPVGVRHHGGAAGGRRRGRGGRGRRRGAPDPRALTRRSGGSVEVPVVSRHAATAGGRPGTMPQGPSSPSVPPATTEHRWSACARSRPGTRTVMKTVILCGGKGTRAYPHTVDVPKPLLYVGGRPVLAHVMEIYANQGFGTSSWPPATSVS